MSKLPLTQDQRAAYLAFIGFINNPDQSEFSLEGYAGTGKSTLVNRLLTELPATLQAAKLITQSPIDWEIVLTATTNKAAEALSNIVNQEVKTIQSFLGLTVEQNHKAKTSKLVKGHQASVKEHCIIFVDEASFADKVLMDFIDELTENCKIIYIGDPAQLTPIKTYTAPVFEAGYPTAKLNEVVRQAEGNPIIDLATAFRNMVNGEGAFSFTPDGHHIQHMSQSDFEDKILEEFSSPDNKNDSARVLAWRNKTVIHYNHEIREAVQGVPHLQAGDYAVCNSYVNFSRNGEKCNVKTDQEVMITKTIDATRLGVDGWMVHMTTNSGNHVAFMPSSLADKKAALRKYRKDEAWDKVKDIEDRWIDLRAAFACTVNKSQGSTYDKVFIDLNDIGACFNANTMARMLYVAVSRARHHVYLTGDWN